MNFIETQTSNQEREQYFLERFGALNPEQQKAVQTIEGPLLVVAGPGSGKTELLSLRAANILRLTDTLPSSILCLTFTDSAAVNMQKRLESLIGAEAYKVATHTFHSFGSEIIAQNPEYFYKGSSYSPADDIKQLEILQDIFETLPHTSLLGSRHPEHGYTYIKEAKERIGDLKKGGLKPAEFRAILEKDKVFLDQSAPLFAEVFEGRISKSILPHLEGLVQKLGALPSAHEEKSSSKSLSGKIVESLTLAVQEAVENGNTKPITEWKNRYTKKDDRKQTILKDSERLQKNLELCNIYEQYIQKLHQQGLFDYDDMLLDVIKAFETRAELRFTLQEKFLYILVDEFQDTNGAQMRLLDLLVDSELHEGRPNIMAVGDDDQSIYKFQGANIENILGFSQKFRDPAIIVLTRNYRSTQQILDFARKVILQGEDRLENRLEGSIQKELVASKKDLPDGALVQKEFETAFEEFLWIARSIKTVLDEKKCKPGEIAVLSPRHRVLEAAAKTLNFLGIPVAYERKRNLLEDTQIREIITILRFVDSMLRDDQEQANHLLPEILIFPFWNINRVALWKLAATAYKSRKSWIDVMLASDSAYLKTIAKFFIDLAADAKERTAEEIIDRITGSEENNLPNDEYDDATDQHSLSFDDDKAPFRSPFKQFYFSKEKFADAQSRYFEHLANLQAFIAKIRKHNAAETLYVPDVLKFIHLLESNEIPMDQTLSFSTNSDAVQLMTVYKAKGLEFEKVFVINCQDSSWIRRSYDKLQFPSNLPLSAENDNADDVLRLFFVAITRAKHELYLTHHRFDEKGKEQAHLRFLSDAGEGNKPVKKGTEINITEVNDRVAKTYGAEKFFELQQEIRRHQPCSEDEKHLLKGVIQNYRLSVTHLTNFLNVIEGGPHFFLERSLLRFPQMMSPNAAFGSAMHKALANFYLAYKQEKKLPSAEFLKKQFEDALSLGRLNKNDFKRKLAEGLDHLQCFYDNRHSAINPQDKVEVSFISQQVVINGAPLTGQIDRMHLDPDKKEIGVFDYKTGKSFDSWEPYDEYAQIKAWQCKLQLTFYKILVENSREYRGKLVHTGTLEFLKPKGKEILTLELEISDEETARLKQLIGIVYKKIMALDFPDISKYDKDLFGVGCFIEDLLAGKV